MEALAVSTETDFWYWIAERHRIFLRRAAGDVKPWTDDPILQQYKFTNPFRENDRGTVWLRDNFLVPHRYCADCDKGIRGGFPCESCGGFGWEPALVAFNICWYRMFNWTGTGEALGWITNWDPEFVKELLHERHAQSKQVFTGAHIIYSPPGLPKIDAIVNVCTDLWDLRSEIAFACDRVKSLEKTYNLLLAVNCVGGFMAYEMVTDMRHTRLLEDATDIMTWANLGPGAKRGLQRLALPYKPEGTALDSMRYLLAQSATARGGEFRDLAVYPVLELRDIEHSLCEFDKYCRVKFGEGEPRGKFNGV